MARQGNGSNQAVESGTFTGPQALTIAAFVRNDSAPANGSDQLFNLAKDSTGNYEAGLSWDHPSAGFRGVVFFQTSNDNFPSVSLGTLNADTWYHVALTVTDAATGVIEGFKDGVSQGTASQAGEQLASGVTVLMGALCNPRTTGTAFSDGQICYLGAWNTVLTDNEIVSLAAGQPPWHVRPANSLLGWALGYDSPEPDFTKNGRDGTLVGTPTVVNNPPTRAPFAYADDDFTGVEAAGGAIDPAVAMYHHRHHNSAG